MNTIKVYTAGLLAITLAACNNKENDFDATGTFEATEVTVSASRTAGCWRWTSTKATA